MILQYLPHGSLVFAARPCLLASGARRVTTRAAALARGLRDIYCTQPWALWSVRGAADRGGQGRERLTSLERVTPSLVIGGSASFQRRRQWVSKNDFTALRQNGGTRPA